MNTYGTSSPWTSDSDTGEPAAGEDPGYTETYPDETGAELHGRHEGEPLDPAAAGSAHGTDAAGEPGPADDVDSAGVPADTGMPDTTGTAGMTDGTGDDALSGAIVEDVVVVESVHTGDQSNADFGGPAADSGSTAAGTAAGSDAEGAPVPADSVLAGSGLAGDGLAGPGSDGNGQVDSGPASTQAASGTMPGVGDSGAEWSEIKALFVDDPSASVQRASALVERAVDGFMSSLRQRQDALGSWQEGDAAGTEDLRVALRGYRGLFEQLERMSGQFPARSAG